MIVRQEPRSPAATRAIYVTSNDVIIFAVVLGVILIAGLLALTFYWRTRKIAAQIRQEGARQRREEAEKVLERVRERMGLPSLVELNRLMLTDYHSIATDQAQKSFRSSLRAMLGGFTWLIACFTGAIFVGSLNGRIIAAAMAPVGIALAAFLGRLTSVSMSGRLPSSTSITASLS